MKQLAGLISLASFCAGAVLVEYEIAWRVGGAFILLAGACGLAVVSRALYTAPKGDERADGFHICRPNRRSGIRAVALSNTNSVYTPDGVYNGGAAIQAGMAQGGAALGAGIARAAQQEQNQQAAEAVMLTLGGN